MGDNKLEPLVSGAGRRTLENWAKRRKTAQGLALRARIVLACADGAPNIAVAARLGVSRTTVTKWRARFLARRLDGLGDEPRPGVPRTITGAQVEEVVVRDPDGLGVHLPGAGYWHLPDTALCSALAEFFTWVTAGTTAVAAVTGDWPFADVIVVARPDSEVFSAAVCDGNADLASVANVAALVWTLLSAVCRELRPFLTTLTLPRLLTEVLRLAASVQ